MFQDKLKFALWKRLHRMPWHAIEQWQSYHLRKLIRHARENVPMYQDLWRFSDLSEARAVGEILPRLPTVPRKAFEYKNRDNFIAPPATWNGLYEWACTSGSTGEPRAMRRSLHMFDDMRDEFLAFSLWRCLDWANHGDKTMRSHTARVLQLYDDAFDAHPAHPHVPFSRLVKNPPHYFNRIADEGVRVVQGYPIQLTTLARLAYDYDVQDKLQFKYAISSGEPLLEGQRGFIERTLGCEVYNRYGMEELFWTIASECRRHNGFHPYHEEYIFEIVDENGQPLSIGETGKIVITDLFNYASPFIRYETGDIGHWISKTCPCGLAGKTLAVEGRDYFLEFDGKRIEYIDMNRLTPNLTGAVLQWQLVKLSEHALEMRLVKAERFENSLTDKIRNVIQRNLGDSVDITFSFLSSIPPSSSGKVQIFADESAQDTVIENRLV